MHLDLRIQVQDESQAKLVARLVESTGARITQSSLHIPAVPESSVDSIRAAAGNHWHHEGISQIPRLDIVHWRDPKTGLKDTNKVGIILRAPATERVVFDPGDIGRVMIWLDDNEIEGLIMEFRNRKLPRS